MAATRNRHLRSDRNMFSASDDNAMMKHIVATHSPDGTLFNVRPLIQIIEDIMQRVDPVAAVDATAHLHVHAHATTTELFHLLSNYGWDAKAAITLAAFAMNYGEFWLVAQLYTANPLAKSLAHLKQLPDIIEHGEVLKPRFEAVTTLIKAMLDLTLCIVKFKELPSQYISVDTPELATATAHIPTAVYWIIRSIQIEAYETLLRVMDTPHLDNIKPLKHLIYLKDDQLPLYKSSTKSRVSIDVVRKKIVLLLISDLDISPDEILLLDQMYKEVGVGPDQFEVVWLPVVPNHKSLPWTEVNQKKFEVLQNMMPWFSVFHPSLLDPAAIKYIKEVWHFNHKPLLVVMDPHGNIVNPNAMYMIWIWGIVAFPFTRLREESLWRDEDWRIELLVDSIEPMILDWFTKTARSVAKAAGIQLEMLYVGKSNPKDKVRKINDTVQREKLSDVLPDLNLIWYFWVRLESMLHSKLQHGKSFEDDPILREINVMLTYDGNDQGWAVICRGSKEWMRRANGDTVLTSLTNHSEWEEDAGKRGFLPALNDHLEANRSEHHCNRLILPGTTGMVPERVVCAECGRPMERFILYRCCTD
ncbi:hypothetical protein Ccrd_024684 [Cynara cardunculus var. scolymus]|uniref:Sieve element occlusion n=1 Tax=Cynara cardunculus var. scolymus TaxID=59895 RepID=A0A103XDW1_CYNCS|nr:hypothetical protein Ccrd_024684 [Cynara cardunculus var. scolymus]